MMFEPRPNPDRPTGWGAAILASTGICSLAGTLAGVVWGGIGGRLAMRLLFLTSDERVRGVVTDSGFEIGSISLGTVFLVVFSAIGGAFLGAVGGPLRMVTAGPTWLVALGAGIANAAFFGALLVAPDGVDFNVLDPLWLAVALFVLLPGSWAATVVVLADRMARPGVVFADLPAHIGDRRFGLVGWVVIAVLTTVGVTLLIGDIRTLTTS
jgi:hypothetical protein